MINYELDGKSPSLKVRLLAESVEAQQTHTPTQTSRREHVQNANLQNGNSVRFNVQYREKANPENQSTPNLNVTGSYEVERNPRQQHLNGSIKCLTKDSIRHASATRNLCRGPQAS